MRTHLYLDIDGVLNAYAALISDPRYRAWPDYKTTKPNGLGEVISPAMIAALNDLTSTPGLECFWLTTWEDTAPAWGESIGLTGSSGWTWRNTRDVGGEWGKFYAIRQTMMLKNVKRAIWIDDDLKDEHEASAWAADNGVLALAPHGSHGITPAMITQARDYLRSSRTPNTGD